MPMNARLLRPLATGFNPRSLAGLAVWLDASKESSIAYHTSSVNVATWSDLSGNGRNATQTTSNNAPAYTIGGFNGKNCLTFDGSNTSSGMDLGNLSAVFPTFGEYFCVFDPDNDTDYSVYRTRANVEVLRDSGTNSRVGAFVTTRVTGLVLDFPANGPALASVRVNSSGTMVVRRNGGATEVTSTGNVYNAGDNHGIGNNASNIAGLTFNGKIGEILVFNQEMSASNRQKIEGYLAWKWGLQAQLPYDHPYARSFPGFGSQATPTDADTLTYLAAVKAADGTGVEVGVANAVDDFVKGTKADGTWDAIKASCILAGARTLAGALVPLKGAAPTNNNFVSGDYNRETGLVGNGSNKYLDSNRSNDDDPQNNNHNALYISTANSSSPAVLMGSGGDLDSGKNRFTFVTSNFSFDSRSNASSANLMSSANETGFVGHSRLSAATVDYRINGNTTSANQTSTAPNAVNVFVFSRNTGAAPTNGRFAFYSIGEALDLEALDTRVSALITAIGNAL